MPTVNTEQPFYSFSLAPRFPTQCGNAKPMAMEFDFRHQSKYRAKKKTKINKKISKWKHIRWITFLFFFILKSQLLFSSSTTSSSVSTASLFSSTVSEVLFTRTAAAAFEKKKTLKNFFLPSLV